MGEKVLICLLCSLMLSKTLAKAVNSEIGLIDNVSAESVPRLYSDRSVGVYASASPYAAYSFHVPTFIAPKSNVVPVKEENVVVQNVNGYLKDSYGQRFVQAPQTLAYKSTFPQQFVQLQNLPAHLSQPLVAAAPNLHYTQGTPHFFGQSFTRLPNLQAFSSTPQQLVYSNNLRNLSPSPAFNIQGRPASQHQVLVNNNVYANTQEQSEPKLQKIQEEPKVSATNDLKNQQAGQQITQRNNLKLVQAPKDNHNNKKTVVTLHSNPPVPLLDLTLLEPLKFANPIIPQVQHYLPRINNVKYEKLPEVEMVKKHQMEFIVQNTKSYDSDLLKSKPKKESPKKKQKKHPPQSIAKDEAEIHENPTVTLQDDINESPELSYEINSPNYKETYTEKKVSYNKETQAEPVHISYDEQNQMKPKHYAYEKRVEMKPVNYNYVHNSKQPVQDNREYIRVPEEPPKRHIENIQSEEKRQQHHAPSPQNESEDSGESYDANIQQKHNNRNHKNHDNADENGNRDSYHNYESPQHHKVYYHHSESDHAAPSINSKYPQKSHKGHSRPQNDQQHFQPIVPEYEEDITVLPTHKPHASSHANNNHHHHYNENQNKHSTPQNDDEQHHDDRETYYSSAPIIVGKPKRDNEEESPDNEEEFMSDMIVKQRENEQDFEKAYKDAAYGFPAFNTPSYDVEQHIYNPESYGASHYYKEYDIGKSPLRQYEADGDDFPKFTRSQYKDIRDKTNEEYFDRYVASKPESVAERNNKKEEYYKTFAQQRPERHFANEQGDKNQKAKYTVGPNFNLNTKPQRSQTHSKYRAAPNLEEYDYSKQAPRDNSPHATQTFQRYKSKTHFVEPQYQYGFEPVSIPHLLDSEMAVMASILSPKKAKPGLKKKDNNSWVVKRTVSKGTKAAS